MTNKDVKNGNMANTMEEVVQLGKQMENLRGEQDLKDDERIPDPQQFDESPHNRQ